MLNGIGNGINNQLMDNHVHHVTECIHEHRTEQKRETAGGLRDSVTLSNEQTVHTGETSQNLFQWMGQVINQGFTGIKNFFATGDGGLADNPSHSTHPQDMQIAADSVMAQLMPDENAISDTTAKYFVPAQEEIPANNWYANLKSRVRIKFGEIRNSLSKYLKQDQNLNMGAGNSGTSQNRQKEDKSRLSVYKKDELEIDCIITDDSYLLDSYNRKGDYSKLGKE